MAEKNNKSIWFMISGVLSSIIAGIMYLVTILMLLLSVTALSSGILSEVVAPEVEGAQLSPGAVIGMLIFFCILFLAIAIINTICAKKCFDFAKLDKDGFVKNKTKAIVIIVLLFLFGGTFSGVFALIGLIMKSEEIGAQAPSTQSIEAKLEKVKSMYDEGLISEEEHKKMREKILEEI